MGVCHARNGRKTAEKGETQNEQDPPRPGCGSLKAQTVEDAVSLGPAVAMLADEVESLKKQSAEILPIKNVKYPAALHTAHRFREAHPIVP